MTRNLTHNVLKKLSYLPLALELVGRGIVISVEVIECTITRKMKSVKYAKNCHVLKDSHNNNDCKNEFHATLLCTKQINGCTRLCQMNIDTENNLALKNQKNPFSHTKVDHNP